LVETAVTSGHYVATTTVTSVVGQAYIFSVYAKAGERTFIQLIVPSLGPASGNLTAGFDLTNGTAGTPSATATSTITSVGNGWYRCSIAYPVSTAGTTGYQIRLSLNSSNTPNSYLGDTTISNGLLIWGAQLEQVTYQTTPATYNVTTSAAYYGPRFDYNPVTLAANGLLIEASKTNALLRSQEIDNISIWAQRTGTGVTADATLSPDGTTNADKLIETAVTSAHFVGQGSLTVVAGTSYTISFYAKAAERSLVTINLNSAYFGAQDFATYNLADGTVSEVGSSGTSSIQNAGGGL
jgi:hypothetical protein